MSIRSKLKVVGPILIFVCLVFISGSYPAYWYKYHDKETDTNAYFRYNYVKFESNDFGSSMSMPSGVSIKNVLSACIAFAAMAWTICVVSLILNLIGLIGKLPTGGGLYKFTRVISLGVFLFSLISVLIFQAFPRAMKSDCEDKASQKYGFIWIGDCDSLTSSHKISGENGDGDTFQMWSGYYLLLASTIVSAVGSILILLFGNYHPKDHKPKATPSPPPELR